MHSAPANMLLNCVNCVLSMRFLHSPQTNIYADYVFLKKKAKIVVLNTESL